MFNVQQQNKMVYILEDLSTHLMSFGIAWIYLCKYIIVKSIKDLIIMTAFHTPAMCQFS